MKLHGAEVDDTFAEAFSMVGSRVIITVGRFEPENLDPDPSATPAPSATP